MEPVKEVIKQDLLAAIKAFKKGEFGFVNIMGNRLMSNLLLSNQKDLMIFGYPLKEVSKEFERIRNMGRLEECKGIGEKFLTDLVAEIKDDINPAKVWGRFYQYEIAIRRYLLHPEFETVYKNNIEFTKTVTSMLVKYLRENQELLLDKKNRLLEGILGELSRVINAHGTDRHTLVFYLLLVALNDYYRYLWYSESEKGTISNVEEFKNRIFPHIDKIIDLKSDLEEEELFRRANEILGDLASMWRSYYIYYTEPIKAIHEKVPPAEILPEEAKKKLTRAMIEAIEKEAKKGS